MLVQISGRSSETSKLQIACLRMRSVAGRSDLQVRVTHQGRQSSQGLIQFAVWIHKMAGSIREFDVSVKHLVWSATMQ